MIIESAVSQTERRQALEAALDSRTFARSAQLRAFLTYICERQMAGHPEELSEYLIAVNVLGRAKDYNLADDSAVRNRAYELRQRLEKFYLLEQPGAEVRIEIPRGSYVPSFKRQQSSSAPALLMPVVPVLKAVPPATGRQFSKGTVLAIALLAALLGTAVGSQVSRPRVPAVLREAWGPLADSGDPLLISVATNLHMIVRPHIAPHPWRYPVPAQVYDVYGPARPLAPGAALFMEPAQLSVPLAEMIATATLCNMRVAFGGSYQILPEAEAPVSALRGRNAVLIGSGTNSEAAAVLLHTLPWTIDFTKDDQFAVVDQTKPPGQNNLYVAQPTSNPVSSIQYGLLSVITSVGSGGKLDRIVVISGVGSAGIQSAVEFLCSPERMREMKERFKAAGLPGFPLTYQIVVRCRTAGLRPLSYEYANHVVVHR